MQLRKGVSFRGGGGVVQSRPDKGSVSSVACSAVGACEEAGAIPDGDGGSRGTDERVGGGFAPAKATEDRSEMVDIRLGGGEELSGGVCVKDPLPILQGTRLLQGTGHPSEGSGREGVCLRKLGNAEHTPHNVLRSCESGSHEGLGRVQGGDCKAELMGSSMHPRRCQWLDGWRGRRAIVGCHARLLHVAVEEIVEEG